MKSSVKAEVVILDKKPDDIPLPKDWIATPFRRWCKLAGISYSHAYSLVAAGHLEITKSRNRSLITRVESDRYFSSNNQGAGEGERSFREYKKVSNDGAVE